MLKRKQLPGAGYLNERLVLINKRLHWKPKNGNGKEVKRWNNRYSNKIAGTVKKDGYSRIKLDDVVYLEHRLSFKMAYNYCPDLIDHDDGDKLNNDPTNLVDSNCVDNNNNRHALGTEGIYKLKSGYVWVINYNNVVYNQSGFSTYDEAVVDRKRARDLILSGCYVKVEKKRSDNSTGLTCVFYYGRNSTYFYKYVFKGACHCKYGFYSAVDCAIALEISRINTMQKHYKPSNEKILSKYEEIICGDL